jgi:hypothetical protein
MPATYILIHLVLAAACFATVVATHRRALGSRLLAGSMLVLAAVGLSVERPPEWVWPAMLLRWPDAVFFTNPSGTPW